MNHNQERRFRRLWASTRTVKQIAKDLGVCHETIRSWRKNLDLKQRRRAVQTFYLSPEETRPGGRTHELWTILAQRYSPVITCDHGYRVGPNDIFVTREQAEEIADGKYLKQAVA